MITSVIEKASTKVIAPVDNLGDSLGGMTNGEKIRDERLRRGMSQADLGRALKISQVAVKKIESGETVKSKHEADLLRYLGLEAQPAGVIRPPPPLVDARNRVKVFSSAEGGNGALILSTDPMSYEARPPELFDVDEGYGIVIEGESMVPSYRPGDIAWVNPRLGARREEDFVFYTADPGNERALVKRLVGGLGDGSTAWDAEQYNPGKKLKLTKKEWPILHRIVGRRNRP